MNSHHLHGHVYYGPTTESGQSYEREHNPTHSKENPCHPLPTPHTHEESKITAIIRPTKMKILGPPCCVVN